MPVGGLLGWKTKTINHQTAIFRQINKDKVAAHHDALEFPDGRTVLLTHLCEGQAVTVLQLPARCQLAHCRVGITMATAKPTSFGRTITAKRRSGR